MTEYPDYLANHIKKKPRQARAVQTVEDILTAARQILNKVDGVFTTNHVAERAGFSIGTLYQYFENTDGIMEKLMFRHVQDELDKTAEIIFKSNHMPDDLPKLTRDIVDVFIKLHTDEPLFISKLHIFAMQSGYYDKLQQTRHIRAEETAKHLGIDADIIRISATALDGIILSFLGNDQQFLKSDKFAEILTQMILSGADLDGQYPPLPSAK